MTSAIRIAGPCGGTYSRPARVMLLRKWTAAFRKDGFLVKPAEARRNGAPRGRRESFRG